MNWIRVLLTAVITTAIVYSTCGMGGGMMVLVTLNGFTESTAMPFLILFALVVIGTSFTLSTAISWIYIKARHVESSIRLWHVAAANASVNILIIVIIFAIIAIRNL